MNSSPTSPSDPLSVLIVDDNSDNRAVMKMLFETVGATVDVVGDGDTAINLGITSVQGGSPFSLVVVDIMMPKPDGYMVAGALRDAGYTGPIFAFTAHPTGTGRKRAADAGVDGYFSKSTLKRDLLLALLTDFGLLKST